MKFLTLPFTVIFVSPIVCAAAAYAGDDPFADAVIEYLQGTNPEPGYTNPLVALGSPERFTGEGIFPGVVSAFNSAYGTDEIVSIGAGGYLILRFDTPVTDDPNNLYGVDLLVFGNAAFIDADYPNGQVAGVYSADGGLIEVSADGVNWVSIIGIPADGLNPTVGYVDADPFAETPGKILTDFTRPVDPALSLADFMGLTNQQVLSLYRGSGGGVAIDLAPTGLAAISFVRIGNAAGAIENVEVDAMSDVAPRLPGDVNIDGHVNIDDLLGVINAWGTVIPGGVPADFNLNGQVNIDDLLTVINHWSK